jgi:hypothetical protein
MKQAASVAAKWWPVALALGIALLVKEGVYGGFLLTFMGLIAAWRRWGQPVREVVNAARVSWKWSALLVGVFSLTLLNGGHGVAPLGMLLVLGWERFLVPTLLVWLGILALLASPWVPSAYRRTLASCGAISLLVALLLAQARSDHLDLAALLSLPFLAVFAVFTLHLARIREPQDVAAG